MKRIELKLVQYFFYVITFVLLGFSLIAIYNDVKDLNFCTSLECIIRFKDVLLKHAVLIGAMLSIIVAYIAYRRLIAAEDDNKKKDKQFMFSNWWAILESRLSEIEKEEPFMKKRFLGVRYKFFDLLYEQDFNISDKRVLKKVFKPFEDLAICFEHQNPTYKNGNVDGNHPFSFQNFWFLFAGCTNTLYDNALSDCEELYKNAIKNVETMNNNMNKSNTNTFILCILSIFFMTTLSAQTYSGGSGTELAPYLISSKADMETLATAVNGGNTYSGKYFLLTQDITDAVTTVIGNYTTTSRVFSGVFDGGGYKINLSINANGKYAGVFGYVQGATIKNLGVMGSVRSSIAGGYIGGICGMAECTSITTCCNMADISASPLTSSSTAGGICGTAYCASFIGTTIANCYNTGVISVISSSRDDVVTGGICGLSSNFSISDCYNIGNIVATTTNPSFNTYAGGICGVNHAGSNIITNSLSANATITAQNSNSTKIYAGRIIGDGGIVQNCYSLAAMQINDETRSSQDAYCKDGKDEDITSFQSQLWIEENLDWNFNNAWRIPEIPNNFPILKTPPILRFLISNTIVTYGTDPITITTTSNNTITPIHFTSSDISIAEIGNGIITIKKAGLVTIYAYQTYSDIYSSDTTQIILTINKASLTIQADNLSMIYGDTPQFSCQYEGFVNNETENVLTKLPTFSCSGTATSNVGNYTITPSGAEAENYTFAYKTGQLQISKRDLQVIPDNLSRLYGNTNPAFTLQYEGFVNGNTASNISTKPIATTTATQTSPVGNYEITCSGGNATNYNFVYGTGNLTINKAPLTVTPNNTSRLYGAENPAFTLSYSGFKNSETKTVIAEEPQVSCNATVISLVGQYPITASGGDAQNYSFIYSTGTLTINKAPLTIQADTISMIYGATVPQFTCKYEGFVNNETQAVLVQLPGYSCSGTSTSNVGNYVITPSQAIADNYTITYKNGLLQIEKRDLQVIPDNLSRLYGDYNPAFTFQYMGFVNSDTPSNISIKPTASTTAVTTSPVGSYPITCSGGSATNYNLICGTTGTLTVTKAPLTITANNASRYWGVENPTFSVNYSGFKNYENQSVLTELPQLSCSAVRLSPSGQYSIVVTGGTAPNYDITRVNGTLTVNKNPQPATVSLNFSTTDLVFGMGNVLHLSLEQEDPVLSFQTDITLPSFVSVDINNVTLTNRCTNAQVLSAIKVAGTNNTYRFLIYSPSNKAIAGNTGELITIPLIFDWNSAPTYYSSYSASTSGTTAVFYISDADKPEKSIPNASATFYVHRMGDVNINGTVTISDIVAEVDYILGKNPQPFLFEAGDMNKNGVITILDLTMLVNAVLTQTSSYSSSAPLRSSTVTDANYKLSLSNLQLDYSKGITEGNLILSMDNLNPVVALNWDLTLPDNVSIDEDNLAFAGSRTNNNRHTIAVNKLSEGNTWRFVVYSSQNQEISGNSGELITIPVIINGQTATGQFSVTPSAADLIYSENGALDETTPACASGILANGVVINGIVETQTSLQVYPNPAKDYIFIQSYQPIKKVEIYNQSGICVLKNENVTEKLDVSSLASGFYLARIYVDGMPVSKKIVIRK